MKLPILLTYLLIAFQSIGQITVNVADHETHKPIEDVLLKSTDGAYKYYTNSIGKCTINDKHKKEHYIIFKRGYGMVSDVRLADGDTIYLKHLTQDLEEVVVLDNDEMKRVEVGYYRKHIIYPLFYGVYSVGTIYATHIKDSCHNCMIEKLVYNMQSTCDSVKLRLILFEVDSFNGSPGQIIFSKDSIMKKVKWKTEIDIRDYLISYPAGGIFLGFEFLEKYCPLECELKRMSNTKYSEDLSWYNPDGIWRKIYFPKADWSINDNCGLILRKYPTQK